MKRITVFVLHAGYWLLFLVVLTLFFVFINIAPAPHRSGHLHYVFFYWAKLMTGFAVVPGVLAYYGFYTFLFPRFLTRKKIESLVMSGILTALLAAAIGAAVGLVLSGPEFLLNDGYRSVIFIYLLMTLTAAVNGCFGFMIKGFITWYNEIRIKEELQQKQLETELALVKAQLDPHFLFNTINNIDVLIESEPRKASDYLNKLSEMMRFMLYETKTGRIGLGKEIAYLEKYILLQKIRSFQSDYVSFRVVGNTGDLEIAPMLLIPFVENAFKYVADKKTKNAIRISLDVMNNRLTFICENNYNEIATGKPGESGIGFDLIKRRLSLTYPGHQLTINRAGHIFRVKLILSIHEH